MLTTDYYEPLGSVNNTAVPLQASLLPLTPDRLGFTILGRVKGEWLSEEESFPIS